MQIKKGIVKDRIIDAAKSEFLDKGFEKASLRNIASRAGVTKGNIYTYFKNKDQLFCSIVEPAMNVMKDYMSNNGGDEYIYYYGQKDSVSEKFSIETFRKFSTNLLEYKEELKLLFFSSNGSGYTDFREAVFEMYTESCFRFFKRWNELHDQQVFNVSEMLIHSFAAMYLSFIEEILIHEPGSEELKRYITQIARFVYAGTVNVLKQS